MAGRRKPLRAVSIVFAGFVALVLLSQLAAHFFATSIPRGVLAKDQAVLMEIQRTSTELALGAAVLGLVFAGAVLIVTRRIVAADIDIYRATGLPASSAYLRVVRSHSVRPLEWVIIVAVATVLVDLEFGLSTAIPIGLAVSFAVLILAWLALLTRESFSRLGLEKSGGKSG